MDKKLFAVYVNGSAEWATGFVFEMDRKSHKLVNSFMKWKSSAEEKKRWTDAITQEPTWRHLSGISVAACWKLKIYNLPHNVAS